jgi:small nuclear ribonucleoprotein (snRNP)-like protein
MSLVHQTQIWMENTSMTSSFFSDMIGKNVLIRGRDSGVKVGILVASDGAQSVLLRDARRIWYWSGAFTLSVVAGIGLDPRESVLSIVEPECGICDVIEIIPTTEAARATYDACPARVKTQTA